MNGPFSAKLVIKNTIVIKFVYVEIAPIWDKVHERHSHARDDQIIYELYQRLKVDKLEVECVLGGNELSKGTVKSIETIAFCTDLKQCKAMLSS